MILAEAIRDLGRVPSGHLYARVMEHMTLQQYTLAVDTLKRARLVEEQNFELIWVGPTEPQGPQEAATPDTSSKKG